MRQDFEINMWNVKSYVFRNPNARVKDIVAFTGLSTPTVIRILRKLDITSPIAKVGRPTASPKQSTWNGNAMNMTKAKEIRYKYHVLGYSKSLLVRSYGRSISQISSILNNQSWIEAIPDPAYRDYMVKELH